jgi:putative chitinase
MTPGIDQLVAAKIKRDVAERWLPHVQKALDRFGIQSERQVAAWIAQTAHESGGYTMLVENLNYRATTMAACWPPRFAEQEPDPAKPGKTRPKKDAKGANIPNKFALALEKKPEALANVVYSSRMGNGPTESGDGWAFRGRGLKQLTGRDNVTRCGLALGVDLAANPDLLLQPEYAALSAAWFWSVNKCGPLADANDFVGLTKKINGGTIGLADRQARYEAVLASLNH